MNRLNLGENGGQICNSFREIAKSYAELFRVQKDHVHNLLKGEHNLSSGLFRENLFKQFLENILPEAVSVDSGFIYGFDQISNSKQIDILIWDSMRHSVVYRTREFVIVTPESVIAAISIKSKLEKDDIENALDNLLSITPLEIMYRSALDQLGLQPMFRPIMKIVASFCGPANIDSVRNTVAKFFTKRFATDDRLAMQIIDAFQNFDPITPADKHVFQVERIIPKLIVSIESDGKSLLQGWGPPEDEIGQRSYGPGLRRLPYLYPQLNSLTSPLEKLAFHVLTSVYETLGTQGWSIVSAWGEFNPSTGLRVGEASEIIQQKGMPLLDPDRLALSNL